MKPQKHFGKTQQTYTLHHSFPFRVPPPSGTHLAQTEASFQNNPNTFSRLSERKEKEQQAFFPTHQDLKQCKLPWKDDAF